jgi:hypothetical protein
MTIELKYIGKVTANMGTLNALSIALREAADSPINHNTICQKIYTEAANHIYEELDKRGLYDEFK